ncbi:MAG: hypothetical protein M1133_03030 [Armatimonadetes bacterium]|nr:hypothetical protein [Armatimonadota bacterium]
MYKKLVVAIAVVSLAIAAGSVMAGDYHQKTTLVCADCHTMHSSVSHSYAGGAPDGTVTGTTGYAKLLKASDPNALCMTCHNGQTFAPDVVGANTGSVIRQAGGVSDAASGYQNWMGHTLGATDTAPGGTWSNAVEGLECVNCHGAHGGGRPTGGTATQNAQGNWRNLAPKPGLSYGTPEYIAAPSSWVLYDIGTNTGTAAVYELNGGLLSAGNTAHYDISNVEFENPDATTHASAYGDWCKRCHTEFHGAQTDANMNNGSDWVRHPTAGVAFTATTNTRYAGKTNKVKVMSDGTNFTPSCFSCHKAHGNKNAFGLIYMAGTGTVTEEGDDGTQMPDLCHQCHGMGS